MDTKQRTSPGRTQQRKRSSAATSTQTQKRSRSTGSTASTQQRRRSASSTATAKRTSAQQRTAQTRRRGSASAQSANRTRTAAKKRERRPAPEVVYTPPKPFTRSGLLLRLATVVAVVLALTFGISIFFKVQTVTVSGAKKYTAWQVREASGIEDGENLLTFGKAKAGAKIKAELPYVDDVRMGIKLPDTVNIEITEFDVVYSVKAQDGSWWLITATGEVVEKTDSATAGEYTKIEGVQLGAPQSNMQAAAYEPPQEETSAVEGVTTPVTVKASEKLAAALSIVQYLESNGIIGEATEVDVTDINSIKLMYGTRYEVKLGDTSQLNYKISSMKKAISQLDDFHSGTLDVSFTIWPDEVGYTPFA